MRLGRLAPEAEREQVREAVEQFVARPPERKPPVPGAVAGAIVKVEPGKRKD